MDNAKLLPGVLFCPVAALLQSYLVSTAPGMQNVQTVITEYISNIFVLLQATL